MSANLANNPGFESVTGSLPNGWSSGGGWSVDSSVKHSGTYSYKWTTGSPTSTQSIQLQAGVYKFTAWIRTNLSTGSSGIRLQLDLRPTINQWFTTEVINGVSDWTLYEIKNIVIPQNLTATLKLENYNGPSGTAWFDDVVLQRKLPEPVNVFMLYPNYRGMIFSDQSQVMKFDVTVTPPDGGPPSSLTVTGRVKDEATGATVFTDTWTGAPNFIAEIDASSLQTGKAYLVEFSVNTNPTYTYPAYRVSKVPASARSSMNISFDDQNRLLIRGEPRFLLGVYDSGGGYSTSESYWEGQIFDPSGPRRLEGLDINFYLNYWMGEAPAAAMNALMNVLQDHGAMYLQTGNCFSGSPASEDFLIHSSDAYVQDIGDHPGSAGYYTADECKAALVESVFDQYVRLRNLDPDSMTFAALFGDPDLVLWRDAADVIATDPYPLFGSEPPQGYPHNKVADWTINAREAVKGSRPVMTVLQFFKFTSQGRWPTRAEMRNHAYMAIVEGAKGLWWWSVGNGLGALNTTATCPVAGSWCSFQQDRFNDLKAVVSELAALEPVLLADDAPWALVGNSNPTAIKTLVKVVDGTGYIFAYNYENSQESVTFTWNTAPGTVTVHNESRNLSVNANSFSDTFGPYQAHVYVVQNGGSAGATYTAPKVQAAPTIDGNLSEYANAPVITLTDVNGTTGEYRILWDDNALYVAASVSDAKLETLGYGEDGSIFQEDTLEFMLDTQFDRGSSQDADDYKFYVNIANVRRDEKGGSTSWDGVWSSAPQVNGTINNGSDTDTGYTIEVRVPWSTLGLSTPPQGTQMGFQLLMNDRFGGVWKWAIWSKPTEPVNVPDNWGTLVLGAPAASPWSSQDIGAVGIPGSFSESQGTFTVNASGADIWGTADEFHFVYQPWSGDVEITARVTSLEETHCCSAKAGLMIRESLDAGSRHALITLESGDSVTFLRRTSTNGSTTFTAGGSATAPVWLKLVRSGNTIEGYRSADGSNWTLVGSASITMGSQVYVGLAVTAHNDTTLNTSTFENVNVE